MAKKNDAELKNSLSYLALAQGLQSSVGTYYANSIQAAQYESNMRLANLQAEDAIRRGGKQAEQAGKEARQIIGAQRASFAAQNIDVDSGTALDIQMESQAQASENQQIISNNAWREAWGYKVDAMNSGQKASQSRTASYVSAGNTILTGGMNALNYRAQFDYLSKKSPNVTTGES